MSSLRIKTTRNVRASRGKNSYRNCKYWSHRDDSSMSKEWRRVNTFFSPRIFNSTTGLQGFLGHSSYETSSLKLTVGEPAGRKMCCSLSDMTGQATAPALTINDTHLVHLCHSKTAPWNHLLSVSPAWRLATRQSFAAAVAGTPWLLPAHQHQRHWKQSGQCMDYKQTWRWPFIKSLNKQT